MIVTTTNRKRFARGALVLVAAGATAACSDPGYETTQYQRAGYTDQAACVRDWQRADLCQRGSTGSGYVGPLYNSSGSVIGPDGTARQVAPSTLPSNPKIAETRAVTRPSTTPRGGFGSTARSSGFSSGG